MDILTSTFLVCREYRIVLLHTARAGNIVRRAGPASYEVNDCEVIGWLVVMVERKWDVPVMMTDGLW
jgi:hypothetical protein